MDWKRGRWGAELETQKIGDALRGWQPAFGDIITYYRFDFASSEESNIYDESIGTGRHFKGPVEVPVLHVIQTMGEDELDERGFYTNDTISVTCGFRQLARTGLQWVDLRNGSYLRDRFAYNDKLFRILGMATQGKLVRSYLIVEVTAVQLKTDEIADDAQFSQYAVDPMAIGAGVGTYGYDGYGEEPYGGSASGYGTGSYGETEYGE